MGHSMEPVPSGLSSLGQVHYGSSPINELDILVGNRLLPLRKSAQMELKSATLVDPALTVLAFLVKRD